MHGNKVLFIGKVLPHRGKYILSDYRTVRGIYSAISVDFIPAVSIFN